MKPWKPVSRISWDWNRFWTICLIIIHYISLLEISSRWRFFLSFGMIISESNISLRDKKNPEELPSLEPSYRFVPKIVENPEIRFRYMKLESSCWVGMVLNMAFPHFCPKKWKKTSLRVRFSPSLRRSAPSRTWSAKVETGERSAGSVTGIMAREGTMPKRNWCFREDSY